MDFKYMIVAFLDEQPEGKTLEPPKSPHVTVKKKFKLIDISENELIQLLCSDVSLQGIKELITGESEEYGTDETMMVKVRNVDVWQNMHLGLLKLLSGHIESRDSHFEGKNYLPHITWRLKGQDNLEPESLENRKFLIRYLYLIERVHPTKSIARIVARLPLTV